jgi:hypothetical protein
VEAVFVVGVLEEAAEYGLSYNCVYIVTPELGAAPILMSRKMEFGAKLPQAVNQPVGRNPIEYGQVCIATAVCNDYHLFYRGDLADSICANSLPRKVFCIPACMSSTTLTFTVPALAPWPGNYAVLANSNPWGCGSFIKNRVGEKRPSFG